MSTVLWCSLQSDSYDYCPDDLGLLYDRIEELDGLCAKVGVKPLSAFLDESDVEFNLSEEELDEDWLAQNARWFAPEELLASVEALLKLAKSKNSPVDPGVAEELVLVRERCVGARDAVSGARLLIVM